MPAEPHSVAVVPPTQAPCAVQQPPSHEVPSQTQVPFTQRWPVMQAEPPPHEHVPCAVHESARPVSQVLQSPPGAAQVVAESGRQVSPSQHPEGQLAAVQRHWPPTQR